MGMFLQILVLLLTKTVVDRRSTATTGTRPLSLAFVQQPFHVHHFLRRGNVPPRDGRVPLLAITRSQGDDDETTQTNNQDGKPPPYNANELARVVFSNLFFYDYYEVIVEVTRQKREKVLKNMTVGDVRFTYVDDYPKGKQQGMKDFADLIGARNYAIEAFLDPKDEPVEATLDRMSFIDLTNIEEVKRYKENRVDKLPIAESIWKTTSTRLNSLGVKERAFPLCLVLGPSGSGKTCFALEYTRKPLFVPAGKHVVTVLLHAGKMGINFKQNRSLVAEELINSIRERCATKSGKPIPKTLDMHVCLVFDEAGSSYSKAWFEDRGMLEVLCDQAKIFATSVTVAVVGTGLTGRELSSANDAYVFRMQPWQANDLSKVLKGEENYLRLEEQETVDTVAHAIFAHPKLSALATNGRSAFLMGRAVANLSSRYPRLSWDFQLSEWTEAIVAQVVEAYVSLNGIKNLETKERRRVAASVFRAIQNMKEGDTSLPTFSELDEPEIPVAESLLQYNLERGADKLRILPPERFAFTLTPAIVLILYSMAGVYTTFLPGWKSEEELAAHYAVRQSMLQCMELYVAGLNQNLDRDDCRNALDESLARIRLVRLQKKLQSNATNVRVPMVDGKTIMMNSDTASFADVIAPFTLIQAKHKKDPSQLADADVYVELKKCGLVKTDDCDTRLLRGLIAVWQNQIDINSMNRPTATPTKEVEVRRNPQLSKAFPENTLCLVPPKDPIRYAVIEGKTATAMTLDKNGTKVQLPGLDGTNITFILSTNSQGFRLSLGESIAKVTITEANINDDLEMNVETLNDSDKSAWNQFVEDRMREGVQVKFLFTS